LVDLRPPQVGKSEKKYDEKSKQQQQKHHFDEQNL